MSSPLRSTTADNPLAGLLATVVPLGAISRDFAASDRRGSSMTVSPPRSPPHDGHDVASGGDLSPHCGQSAGSPPRWSGRRSRVRTQPRVAGRPPAAPRKPTKWIVFPRWTASLPGVSGYPGRPADADLDRRECPADSRAARADAGRSRRAGGAGAEDHPALGDRQGEPDDRARCHDRGGTRCERVDPAAAGEAEAEAGRTPAASAIDTLDPSTSRCGLDCQPGVHCRSC